MTDLLLKDEVYALVGAAMDVYNELGNGFWRSHPSGLEAVYQEAYEMELIERNIRFDPQRPLPIYYKTRKLKKEYKADIVAYEKIILELKAQESLTKNDEAQLLNYLNATKLPLGVLINFGAKNNLEWKRMILTR